tara:strand:+ start:186 stop:782 length:597 start_codon:yes stop_codon:yes gene_type:complete
MGIRNKNIKNGNGISYSKEVDSSADWSGVTNSTYFKDLSDSLIYYKNSGGTVVSLFEEGGGGGGTPALNNGQIFVGNASNNAVSVSMSGDTTISNTGIVTIGNDKVTYPKIQDTTQACILGNQTGSGAVSEIPIVEQYISSSGTIAGYLNATANWDVNGNYLGTAPTITGTYQGQAHYNGNYWFTAVDDNVWIRLIRG